MSFKPFIEHLRDFADQPALQTPTGLITYSELYTAIGQQLDYLHKAKIATGQTVFLQGDYSSQGIAMFLALYQNNNIIALNTSDNDAEIESKRLSACADYFIDLRTVQIPDCITHCTENHELVNSLRIAQRSGLILFSSGTTGKPKAMLHDLDNLVDGYLGRRAKATNILLFLLFDHIGGINTLFNILSSGGTAVIAAEKTPKQVAALIERFKVVVLPTSPTFLNLLLVSGVIEQYDFSSLRLITYGTEPMPESLLGRLRQHLPKVKLLQTFGTSETGIVSTTSRASGSLFMKFNDDSIEHKVVDGELWLRSKRQILGYLNHSSNSFTEDGWYKTGDLVEQSEDGYLRIQGRNKEIINVGGEKVFPVEVESVLQQLPFVQDCQAYGHPNAITGQSVYVDVVLRNTFADEQKIRVREIKEFARVHMDAYKVPSRINIVPQLNYSSRFKKVLVRES